MLLTESIVFLNDKVEKITDNNKDKIFCDFRLKIRKHLLKNKETSDNSGREIVTIR